MSLSLKKSELDNLVGDVWKSEEHLRIARLAGSTSSWNAVNDTTEIGQAN
jgi:hypothetical protein